MHDPKFEKQVQERMEGLQFNPSDQVWVRLERELNKEKRRTLPLFWPLFLLSGILIGAGGAWFLIGSHGPLAPARAISQESHAGSRPDGDAGAATPRNNPANPSTDHATLTKSPATHTESPATPTENPARTIGNRTGTTPQSGDIAQARHNPITVDNETTGVITQTVDNAQTGHNPQAVGTPPTVDNPPTGMSDPVRSGITVLPDGTDALTGLSVYLPLPLIGNAPMPGAPSHSQQRPEPGLAKNAKKTPVMYKRPVWQAGFAGGVGLSSLNDQGLLPSQSFALNALSTAPATQYGGYAAASSLFTAKTSPGISFWAGVFVQKPIGRRLALSAGLNLHYYSSYITTGQQVVNNTPYPTPSLFYPSAIASSSRTYPYYLPGDNSTYLNRYYFLELPVSLQWQFNKGDKIPLFVEGDLALSHLMSVNALYYNQRSSAFYKYGSATTDPLQLSGSVALMAGFHWGTTRMQVGPQMRYGVTNLIKPDLGPQEHLAYGGIKLVILPGWK